MDSCGTDTVVISGMKERAQLVLSERQKLPREARYLLGVTGSPAAGKSTFSLQLVAAINKQAGNDVAIVVPMDGFHLSNEELDRINMRHLKGIPETFNGSAFVELIQSLKLGTDKPVFGPAFDRSIESTVENAIEVTPKHKIVVVEGNYLLIEEEPWARLQALFNEIWFLSVAMDELMPRLIDRHIKGGKDEQAALAKIGSTDLPNARLIEQCRTRADRIIDLNPTLE